MRTLLEFVKTTVLGGLLVILPIVLTAILMGKALSLAILALNPVANHLPANVHFTRLVALLLVLLACFLTGLAMRTRLGRLAKDSIERSVLERLPGYSVLRAVGRSFLDSTPDAGFVVAMVEMEDGLVPAFVIEEHADGRCTVFVPAVPTPTVGNLYVMPGERVHRTSVPFARALRCITQWGTGSGELLRGMRPAT